LSSRMDFQPELANLERVSPVMGEMLRRHPEWEEWLRQRVTQAASEAPALELQNLCECKQRETIGIALRDLAGIDAFVDTVSLLSRLAEKIIAAALGLAWDEVASRMAAPAKKGEGFAVIALGKLGGGELNYSSDIDLLFCRRTSDDDSESRFFTRLGERLVHVLGHPGADGFLYRVDMRLRPYGQAGPLVPTIDSLENYYESWGEAWERQALIKARPVGGDPELGRRFMRFAAPFVFARQMNDSSLEEIKQVKHRSEKEYATSPGKIHVKQGPGGIRDIEFYIQYLQLVAGSRHPEVRSGATLEAIHALGEAKALLEGEESLLAVAYMFLRIIEHRLQLRSLAQESVIPENRPGLEALAGGLGFANPEAFLGVLHRYRALVRAILEKVYLTPGHLRPREMEQELAQLLTERAPRERVKEILSPYGFRDVDKAWQNIRLMALGPAGHLLPPAERRAFLEVAFAMLEVLRDTYDPDQALHHLESFAAASGNRVSFLRTLASRRPHLARLANLLSLSNLCHQILMRHPEYFDSLARGVNLHVGRGQPEMTAELEGRIAEAPAGEAWNAARRFRQREMVRIAYRDLALLAGPGEIGRELSDLAEACVRAACSALPGSGAGQSPPLYVIALGKLGSRQMHYSSDLDLMFLYPDPPADSSPEKRTRLQLLLDERAERLLEALAAVTPEGTAYKIDLRLRPEGGTGLLARSWNSFLEHGRQYMQPWERLALVRSRILADDEKLKLRWEEALSEAVYEFRWDADAVAAVRHIKRRIEAESNKESRICLDFKFGAGGVADLEFTVRLLQALHGRDHPAARAPETEMALAGLREAGILGPDDAGAFLAAHLFQRGVENHFQLVEEYASREISRESPVLDRLARSLGYPTRKEFLTAWDETARKVRNLAQIYFYGA